VDPKNPRTSAEIDIESGPAPNVEVAYMDQPFVDHGINFLGKILVRHVDGNLSFSISIPGEWTYDPSAISGSAHASERIGGDCFTTQLGITVAQVVAWMHGCPEVAVYQIQLETLPIITKYH
jgi:hypothetical protein